MNKVVRITATPNARHGLQVNPWTANKEGIIRFLATIGVDHIITDYPDVALRITNEVYEGK